MPYETRTRFDTPVPPVSELYNSDMVAFDVESSGVHLGKDFPYGYSITDNPGHAWYASIEDGTFRQVLEDPNVLKIAHNAKFDRAMLAKKGITVDNLCDPMIAAHLLENESLSLHLMSAIYLWHDFDTFESVGRKSEDYTLSQWADLSCNHSMFTYLLWLVLEQKLRRLKLLDVFWDIEMPLVPVLSDMERNGVTVDKDELASLGVDFDAKLAVLEEALDNIAGIKGMNHNSGDQAAHLLYDVLGLPPGHQTPGAKRPSVDKRYLAKIKDQHPYIGVYLYYKQFKTLKSSYVNSLSKQVYNGRVYGSFNQTRTRTGRLSSSDPNLQKIPQRTAIGKKIRTAFKAPEGYKLLVADYDIVELKEMALFAHDEVLLSAFREGRDIHTDTAIRAFNNAKRRSDAKTLNYQVIYGGGEPRLRKLFFKAYPQLDKWIKSTTLKAREDLYVRTRGGRIRTIPELGYEYSNWIQKHSANEAISTIIQGSTSEDVKKGMVKAWKALGNSVAKGVLQVHDEVVYEVPEKDVDEVSRILRKELTIDEYEIPLTVTIKVGDNWGEMKELKEGERYAG